MAWIFQRKLQVEKLGPRAAPWYVGWRTPDGKAHMERAGTKTLAKKLKAKKATALAEYKVTDVIPCSWDMFVKEYDAKILREKRPTTRQDYLISFEHFKRIVRPTDVHKITTNTIDEFRSARLKERGAKKDSTLSPATVNGDLRALSAALTVAVDWKYIKELPKFKMAREDQTAKRYVPFDHFELIYDHCDVATAPGNMPYPPSQWWRAFLTFAYLTGWRRNEILRLTWEEVDFETGIALTLASKNKGRRDEQVSLHPMILEHIDGIRGFRAEVFPWDTDTRRLYPQFHAIQEAAGIKLPCRQSHKHTPSCTFYGFHDLRRGFATVIGDQLDSRTLQRVMRHKCFTTTLKYIQSRPDKNPTDHYNVPNLRRNSS